MSTHDTAGRPWAKLSELKQGDELEFDADFTCDPNDEVDSEPDGRLFVLCAEGKHYLDGQCTDDGEHLIGIYGPIR